MQEDEIEEGYYLAAHFFTSRVLSMEAITRTFKLLWRTRKGFEVRDLGNHKVLFKLSDPSDVDRILKGEPWSFDKYLVALKRVSKHTNMRSLVFDKTSFWVQVHNLPIGSFSMAVAKDIASIVGMVDESETEVGDGEGYSFLRVQIAVNPSILLCRGKKIARRDGSVS